MKLVFMGTPDFGRACLQALLDDGRDVAAVFTQPDRPKGRGMHTVFSPVKALAVERGIDVFQPETFRDGQAAEILRQLAPDLVVTAAYGKLLPADVLAIPPMGCINVHGSLLPKYRGAAPVQWAVLNGETTTGVTVQYMAPRMDSGDIISSAETAIGEYETSGELFDRLTAIGAELLVKTVRSMEKGEISRTPQDESEATYTVMLDKSMSPIDWDMTPTAVLGGEAFRIFRAEYTDARTALPPGKIVCADRRGIEVACGGGSTLRITELQPAGKKRMSAAAFLWGHPLKADG